MCSGDVQYILPLKDFKEIPLSGTDNTLCTSPCKNGYSLRVNIKDEYRGIDHIFRLQDCGTTCFNHLPSGFIKHNIYKICVYFATFRVEKFLPEKILLTIYRILEYGKCS